MNLLTNQIVFDVEDPKQISKQDKKTCSNCWKTGQLRTTDDDKMMYVLMNLRNLHHLLTYIRKTWQFGLRVSWQYKKEIHQQWVSEFVVGSGE